MHEDSASCPSTHLNLLIGCAIPAAHLTILICLFTVSPLGDVEPSSSSIIPSVTLPPSLASSLFSSHRRSSNTSSWIPLIQPTPSHAHTSPQWEEAQLLLSITHLSILPVLLRPWMSILNVTRYGSSTEVKLTTVLSEFQSENEWCNEYLKVWTQQEWWERG
jgi:hypothetical protein